MDLKLLNVYLLNTDNCTSYPTLAKQYIVTYDTALYMHGVCY